MHIFRWDLDRTYLETEIHSVRGLVRAAFEEASEKKTVPGAGALLRALQLQDPGSRLVVLSGSPLQMREVLEQKLRLDGVRVDRLILKDNLGNLRRGRFRALRGQLGYKLPHLLEDRTAAAAGDRESLFGDDAEVDGLVYAAYAAAVSGELDRDALVAVLQAGGAYPDTVEAALAALAKVARADAVEDIFIRLDRGIPLDRFRLLGPLVVPVSSWFQAALVLSVRGRISPAALTDVAEACALDVRAAAGSCQDLVRRGALTRAEVLGALTDPGLDPLRGATESALRHLGSSNADRRSAGTPDFLGFLRSVQGS